MKFTDDTTRTKTCRCGVTFEYNNINAQHGGDVFRQGTEEYIICPKCGNKIVIKNNR